MIYPAVTKRNVSKHSELNCFVYSKLCVQQYSFVCSATAIVKDDTLSHATPFLCVPASSPVKQYMKNHGLFMQHKNNLEIVH